MICDCGGTYEIVDTNGADYPETLVEFYECTGCGDERRKVLSA